MYFVLSNLPIKVPMVSGMSAAAAPSRGLTVDFSEDEVGISFSS